MQFSICSQFNFFPTLWPGQALDIEGALLPGILIDSAKMAWHMWINKLKLFNPKMNQSTRYWCFFARWRQFPPQCPFFTMAAFFIFVFFKGVLPLRCWWRCWWCYFAYSQFVLVLERIAISCIFIAFSFLLHIAHFQNLSSCTCYILQRFLFSTLELYL